MGEDHEEADKHDDGQKCRGEQAGLDAEADPIRQHHIQKGPDETCTAGTTTPSGQTHVTIVMCETQKAQLAATTADARQDDTNQLDGHRLRRRCEGDKEHAGGGEGDEDKNAGGIGYAMDEVRSNELGQEAGHNIGEEDDALGDAISDKILGGRKDDDIKDIVDEAWCEMLAHFVKTR